MKNALEQEDLVTNSGREPGGFLLLSLTPHLFSRQSLWWLLKPLPRLWCNLCPELLQLQLPLLLRGQALLPFSPVTGAEATNSCRQTHISSTKGRRRLPALANAEYSYELEEPSVHLQTSSRHDLRFLTHFISTEQLQLGRAGPSPAAEKIL